MKTRRTKTVSICIVIAYILSVVTYAAVLGFEFNRGTKLCQDRFASVTRAISTSLRAGEPGSKNFYDTLLSALGDMEYIASLKISEGEKPVLLYPVSNGTKSAQISETSPLIKAYSSSVNTMEGPRITFSVAFYRLTPRSIFYKGCIAGAVILIASAFCLVYILTSDSNTDSEDDFEDESDSDEDEILSDDADELIENINYKSELKFSDEEIGTEPEETLVTEEEISAPENAAEPQKAFVAQENVVAPQPVPAAPESVAETQSMQAAPESVSVAQTAPAAPVNASEPQTQQAPAPTSVFATQKAFVAQENVSAPQPEPVPAPQNIQTEGQGLFSPVTGFGWESYLIPRLDKELIRAASSEQDLALLTIRIPGINWETPAAKKICKIILDTIKFDDLVFNYGNDGCYAILQNESTDSSIQIAEEMHTNMLSVFSEEGLKLHAFIGISTRSLRLISGERLANESRQALLHAEEETDSPIVAFRVNPEKYRNYMAGISNN